MRRENEKLIIDGNAIYELDLECVRKKQGKQDGNGRCVEQPKLLQLRPSKAIFHLFHTHPLSAWKSNS